MKLKFHISLYACSSTAVGFGLHHRNESGVLHRNTRTRMRGLLFSHSLDS